METPQAPRGAAVGRTRRPNEHWSTGSVGCARGGRRPVRTLPPLGFHSSPACPA
jgi:hypothetical protein